MWTEAANFASIGTSSSIDLDALASRGGALLIANA
jgi:hypothetical protein